MKRSKKGSHVGMMISFGIFVVFLVFLYSVLQPILKSEQDKKLILNDLIEGLMGKFDPDLTYTSGSIKTVNANFVAEMNTLVIGYNSDYEGLKNELNIAEANEFGFVFVDEVGGDPIAPQNSPPDSVNIYAKKIPVYSTSGEENVLLGFITLKIW